MKTNFLFAVLLTLSLVGCSGSAPSTNGASTAKVAVITPFVPLATTVAAKQVNYATNFFDSIGVGLGCTNLTNKTVYVLPNSETYASTGVSELAQQQAAEYAEVAIISLRNTLGLLSSVGFQNTRVQICVQPAKIGSAVGVGAAKGFTGVSSDSTSIETSYLVNDYELYKRLIKHELVHTYQLGTLQGSFGGAPTWFSEGLAEYVANGLSIKPKADILSLLANKNPLTILDVSMGSSVLNYYPSFQDTVGYLYNSNGAKNSLIQVPALMSAIRTATTNQLAICNAAGTCATATLDAFTIAFENTVKEADGTLMKLNTGTNNLKDSIIARLTSFL
jgi:hypothetical protein